MEVNRLRHVCFAVANETSNIPEAIYKVKNLRTFISSTPNLINNTCAAQTLLLVNCSNLKDLPGDINKLFSLRHLIICKTRGHDWIPPVPNLRLLDTFPFPVANIEEGNLKGHYFQSLNNISIVGWPKVSCLPDQIQYLTSLEHLGISGFESLEVLPEWLGNLDSLSRLDLRYCDNLKNMPSREQLLRLTSLENLGIGKCPLLEDRCQPGGEEYNKISHIPKVEFR
ncbi:hypothetical protein MKW98_030094 [Papaver atlanticum]|uniref:R13L1/DRL21-like LRR repeat region domain-containing protein n=1 Tax=Papaver atlanticum TaxID=357466 RepID=A0AAD4T7P8_9MAGN|nr:hypothetical protein MKW98_030094 [Papaver atlanticum]